MPKPAALIVAVAVLALAFVLNPSADKHREKIKAAVAERSQLERLLGIGQLTSFASRYHSLGVASYTTVGDEVVSVGAFGLVVVP
jgi:predicted flap endonuclease-1-like 5' DNA nuclease